MKSAAKMKPPDPGQTSRQPSFFIALGILIVASVFLFARLGTYALWDDEAGTALYGLAVWRTGDTTAVLDHNIIAYQAGKDLTNLRERFMPPLPAYLTAPFVGLLGQKSWAARLPFALCGLFCVLILFRWLEKIKANTITWLVIGMALLCNVSFFLLCRNCRYYGVAIFTTTAMAYLYWSWKGERKKLVAFVILSICLFASNYLNYIALYLCLIIDALLWRRKEIRLRWDDGIILLLPQIIICGLIFWIWNPLAKPLPAIAPEEHVSKPILFWWYWRDSVLEYSSPVIVVLALLLCFFSTGRRRLMRLLLILLAYITVMTFVAPHPPGGNENIEVRYLAPCIPLFIAMAAAVVLTLTERRPWLAISAGFLMFVINWHPLAFGPVRVMPTVVYYVSELMNPPSDPYTAAAKWINENLREKQTIWAWPGWTAYPLMFHAPKPVYAWQLTSPPKEQFKGLDPIHFQGQSLPERIIVFGPEIENIFQDFHLHPKPGVRYDFETAIEHYWQDMFRPEFLRRSFTPITEYNKKTESIFILKRTLPPIEGSE